MPQFLRDMIFIKKKHFSFAALSHMFFSSSLSRLEFLHSFSFIFQISLIFSQFGLRFSFYQRPQRPCWPPLSGPLCPRLAPRLPPRGLPRTGPPPLWEGFWWPAPRPCWDGGSWPESQSGGRGGQGRGGDDGGCPFAASRRRGWYDRLQS
jgi:hypothetical protein